MDRKIFEWARSRAQEYALKREAPLKKKMLTEDEYTEKYGHHTSIYVDEAGKYDALLRLYYEDTGGEVWYKVTNFAEYYAAKKEIVELWLRNGEYVYTQHTGGKDLKIVELWYRR